MMLEQILEFITTQLDQNELLAGGAMLGLAAAAFNYLRYVPMQLARVARWLVVTELDIPDKYDSFSWVGDWLSQNKYTKTSKRVSVETKNNQPYYTPAPGWHLLWWGNKPLLLRRIRNESKESNRSFYESWKITIPGRARGFIEACKKISDARHKSKLTINMACDGFWDLGSKQNKRPLESVVLPLGVKESLIDSIDNFYNSEQWYSDRGVPWRLGILLHGAPGNGKSSLVAAVASHLNAQIYTFSLKGISDRDLPRLIQDVNRNSVLLIEDIDCVSKGREVDGQVSFSTLLNCLDGLSATEGRLLFITTNHPEHLDPALVRPGRIDIELELSNPTDYQIASIFYRFYLGEKCPPYFIKEAESIGASMATLQGHFLKYKDSPTDAIKNIKELE
jgi:chaperone BCS1